MPFITILIQNTGFNSDHTRVSQDIELDEFQYLMNKDLITHRLYK